ncbi:hypothetical protein V5799_012080 [Amblyomma americanum]|uniref:M13 family peptidase n=1 Tax=Amblyomma americanum TaxID=6943 RepID=A0AAQ4EF26_AMBAM
MQQKRRLQLKANTQYLQYAESRDSTGHRQRRRSPGATEASEESRTPDVGRNILHLRDRVYTVWKKAGNLRAYSPQVAAVRELDRHGLSSAILMEVLNQSNASQFPEAERIEVANEALLPFLAEVLRIENVKEYVAWEFVRHSRVCGVSIRIEEKTLTNSCFDCVERVAGLAAHAPFLIASHDAVHQAKISFFLRSVRDFMVTALSEASWLPSKQQERMTTRVYGMEFVLGVPARHNGTRQLNGYYDYLPPGTGSFARDYSDAVRAFWNWSLRRASDPFPLLSSVPNVLSANNTVYIPAVALVPPLFDYDDSEPKNYGFTGVAVIRAVAHSLGLTGLQPLPYPYDVETPAHFDDVDRCLRLNRSMRSYSSRLADVMAVGAALRALGERRKEHRSDGGDRLLFNSCLLMCTAQDPRRCDEPARQTGQFQDLFRCPRQSPITIASQCAVW